MIWSERVVQLKHKKATSLFKASITTIGVALAQASIPVFGWHNDYAGILVDEAASMDSCYTAFNQCLRSPEPQASGQMDIRCW